ncbi:MAG TPA: YdeI/OmpD-associated family protein [Pyrinomonadaceae bacterium]
MATKKAAAKSAAKSAGKAAVRSPARRFRALVRRKEGGEVCSIDIPFDVEKTFGARGRVPVRGTLNGAPFRSSAFRMGGGCHFMVVNRRMREAAGVRGGETVPVVMERDTEPRIVEPPADFARALKSNRDAQAVWDKLSYTHRREHAEHIEEARRPETRQRRIEKSIALLAAGRKEPR